MNLYGQYAITPDEHTVSHPERAEQSYAQLGLKKALGYLVTGVMISGILLGVHLWLNAGVMEDRYEGFIDWIATLVWGLAGFIGLFMFPYMLWAGIRCLLTSCFRPNLSKPESVLKTFLNSTRSSLNIRAYNLLTDQAQKPGKVTLTGGIEALAKRIPDIEIGDFDSFDDFWIRMDMMSWSYKLGRIERTQLDNDASILLRVPATAKDPNDDNKKIRFSVEFVAVRRNSHWYLANGFVWPI